MNEQDVRKRKGKELNDLDLDAIVREALYQKAESLQVKNEDAARMCSAVRSRIKEEPAMRKWSKRKMILAAAIICAFGSITAVAAGRVTSSISSSNRKEEIRQYDQIGTFDERLHFGYRSVESFTNGYTFEYALPTENQGMDENGNVVTEGTSLSLGYKKDGMPEISIEVMGTRLFDYMDDTDETFEYKGISLYYSSNDFMFVPEGYQVSAEDQAREEAGELSIGYGSETVEYNSAKNLIWEQDGVIYQIFSFDNSMTSEEFCQMAHEIIDA